MDDTKEILVLVGVPGSGKSTWIKSFLNKTNENYVVISSDDIITDLAAAEDLDYNQGFDKFVQHASKLVRQNFKDAINKNKNIIWDQTNLSRKKRRSILADVPENYRKVAVVFTVDDDAELYRRLNKREKETGKHIPDNVVKSMLKNFTLPTKDEGFDEVIEI